MTFAQLMDAIIRICPDATLEEDNYGQIVVYTGLCEEESCHNEQLSDFAEVMEKEEAKEGIK